MGRFWGEIRSETAIIFCRGLDIRVEEIMELKHVKSVAADMELDLKDVKIQIVRDKELIEQDLFGYTSPDGRKIQLYPGAFRNREQLVKTLGHEYTHLQQAKRDGIITSTEDLIQREQEAYSSEEGWWRDYVKKTGYRR